MSKIKEQKIYNVEVDKIDFSQPNAIHSILMHRLFATWTDNYIIRSVSLFHEENGNYIITAVVDVMESTKSTGTKTTVSKPIKPTGMNFGS
ncbi:hypothetical protein [Christiangramia sp.]|uniref:hypothetical protein n=1 Tax=Christiangramia sp. TaxID=1931228 RepID=UPI00262CADC3|nr:hypothetical protein [Christiangramia sp.]